MTYNIFISHAWHRSEHYKKVIKWLDEYYSAAEPPVRCGESHLSGLTEPPLSIAI